jgi:phenylpropionate dioxygenase-like ring-hydroxylating dioxygenase large terminal subunit|nr:aromatic ring-hydroxylating dioxygenase subunit alpha [Kofleriaceae bacterium]
MHVVDGVDLVPPAVGHNLPPRAFTSPAVYDLEQRAIFARGWVHVCDAPDVAQPGSYVAAMIGDTPVIVVRGRDRVLRGFLNACRHRGAQLLEGRGTCDKQIQCPYHAWSYQLDGALVGVPYRDEFALDASTMGLVPVRVDTCGPLVFATLDAAAPALADWVGELPRALSNAGCDDWELAWELRYELDANWKLFVENANDGYHIPFVHDLLTDALVPESGTTWLEPHGAYSHAQINPLYLPDGYVGPTHIRFGCIFPNLIPVLSPSDLTYLRVDPIAHDRLAVFARSYDAPAARDTRELRKLAFERTTDQDLAIVRKTMRGLRARGLPPGVHAAALEERIGHFERTWAADLARELEHAPRKLAVAR